LWSNDSKPLSIYDCRQPFSMPVEIRKTYLGENVTTGIFGCISTSSSVILGYEGAMNDVNWHGSSKCTAHYLLEDGRIILAQENGQICFLHTWSGHQRVTLEELR